MMATASSPEQTVNADFSAPSVIPPAGQTPPPARSARKSRLSLAWQDIMEACGLWRLAVTLGWLDVRLQYSGSTLGPFWLTLTTAVMVGAMGGIYSQLFHLKLQDYLPYISISLILWQNGLSTLIQESCGTFTRATDTLRSVTMPYTVQALRTTIRCGVMFSYTVIVPVVVFIIMGKWPGVTMLLALPALALWLIDCVAFCLLLGSVCARFRDIPPIVGSLLQIFFYVTPVIWEAKQLGPTATWLYLNPFYSMLDIVRMPFLGHVPSGLSWGIALGTSLILCLLSLFTFSRSRSKLAFWV
ncbi:MAG: ABC transporter permease [Acetobacter indonesiensis]|jgi:lipopolysaccharide transport system permease protein|nr:ABC transporter permease [Acetobacter indonesiensis]MCI1546560.1 ABC transporter permease [Acetobacter indonesiensis]MCI1765939.1 ABC transporter permease [Acetobacter indonesiensis]